jgi:hypothetical protein
MSKNISKSPIYVLNKGVKNDMSIKIAKKTERNKRNLIPKGKVINFG